MVFKVVSGAIWKVAPTATWTVPGLIIATLPQLTSSTSIVKDVPAPTEKVWAVLIMDFSSWGKTKLDNTIDSLISVLTNKNEHCLALPNNKEK